jgi:hypothetical protein
MMSRLILSYALLYVKKALGSCQIDHRSDGAHMASISLFGTNNRSPKAWPWVRFKATADEASELESGVAFTTSPSCRISGVVIGWARYLNLIQN